MRTMLRACGTACAVGAMAALGLAARCDDPVPQGSVPPFLLAAMRRPEYRAVERQRFLDVARMDAYTWADTHMKNFMANTLAMHRAGVKIAVGTDAGGPVGYNFQGYNTIREMELLVDTGLSPMDVRVAATRTGAELIGVSDRLGTLTPGTLADFLILDANPLSDISNIRRIRTVVLGGIPHDRATRDARATAHARRSCAPPERVTARRSVARSQEVASCA